MDGSNSEVDAALQGLDETRRQNVRRLVIKGAFITPIVVSFAMAGLTVEAAAASGNTPF